MYPPPVDPSHPYPWRQALRAALLWLGGCSAFGFVIASVNGEHGSIIYFGFGVLVGIAGALCHIALLAIKKFRSLAKLPRALALGCASTTLLLVCAELQAASEPAASVLAYTEALTTVLTFGLVPSLLAAITVVWLTENAA